VRLEPLGPTLPGRNDPCHCGSEKKYKRCHLDADQQPQREAEEALAEALPLLREKQARAAKYDRRLREEHGVFVNYVPPRGFSPSVISTRQSYRAAYRTQIELLG
jgi:hypothetical protein